MASTETLGITETAKYHDVQRPIEHRTRNAKSVFKRLGPRLLHGFLLVVVVTRGRYVALFGSVKFHYEMYNYRRPRRPRIHQVPTTTSVTLRMRQVRLRKNAKYHSCRQDSQVGPRTIDVSWTVYNYRRPEDVGVIKYLSERTCTTTSTTVVMYHYFPRRPVNVYFPYTASNSIRLENARFEASVSFRSCEDSFDYVRLSSSWTCSSS
ncbi:hypothetical protein ACQJBY_017205 [Aegilops geniculata]